MRKIHISNINEIKENKIYYRNNNGMQFRCIGERLFSDYAYYEIYTEGEYTHIYMNLKNNPIKRFISKAIGWNFHSKDFQKFYDIQKRLNANGWTTLDLS